MSVLIALIEGKICVEKKFLLKEHCFIGLINLKQTFDFTPLFILEIN
jgi:hypothetical protein